jgi:hypothetical protein
MNTVGSICRLRRIKPFERIQTGPRAFTATPIFEPVELLSGT